MAETVVDQGTVWWPAGLGKQEKARIVFNVSLQERPLRVTCQDYETREPLVPSPLSAALLTFLLARTKKALDDF